MPFRSLRNAVQKVLAMAIAPRLHWQWSRQRRLQPVLGISYKGQLISARRHRKTYLCRHWGIARRLRALYEHYARLRQLPTAWSGRLFAHQCIALCEVELKSGERLSLSLEPSEFAREGEIGLFLRDAGGERLYSLSFCLGAQHIMIGGLQGPRPSVEAGTVKWLGKEMHGLRPKNLLISALYELARCMGGLRIMGIADAAHSCSDKLRSSYDTFWQELQGVPCERHWYRLPEREQERDIAEVKSQRRSEFRRREALREAVTGDIRRAWALAGGCAGVR
ncbi:VirK/YbjX family protein [Pseudomonas sp. ZM23]|uniref:DUF535 family protein n=1 Tax=Pseudomonas triclosanedens TaxID=2961893 RepID=A0ABY7A116_9PSED|nr:DUF535 family protein [Pseudomonas triclosanedens]MCP8464679.1 VirK/YbjX family protein [Pseudomonas triclosanedens]MCP8473610.1 VirK/YbjX family protein [Pseudomonas triclosanedens]MCP8478447.1 VirK/YbjX family protein [Pseudomonas triclosanedens]WAI50841.1 DUF535 family protein [Pseudomonas triclosanedens]